MLIYAQDYDDYFVPNTTGKDKNNDTIRWPVILSNYTGNKCDTVREFHDKAKADSVFFCPSQTIDDASSSLEDWVSYGLNGYLSVGSINRAMDIILRRSEGKRTNFCSSSAIYNIVIVC
jgi:hypothetical protein